MICDLCKNKGQNTSICGRCVIIVGNLPSRFAMLEFSELERKLNENKEKWNQQLQGLVSKNVQLEEENMCLKQQLEEYAVRGENNDKYGSENKKLKEQLSSAIGVIQHMAELL